MSTAPPPPTTTTTQKITPLTRTRVLSIQSHVVHGCAGNSAACLPMQLHGIDVDTFNILSFSNHTGYSVFRGHRITPEQFREIAQGLVLNGFLPMYDFILSGYIGEPNTMEEVARLVKDATHSAAQTLCVTFDQFRRDGKSTKRVPSEDGLTNSKVLYICDPVMGDCGKLYVSESCVEAYRTQLLPLATMAFPNGFEASTVSGIEVCSVESAVRACEWFHAAPRNVETVVIKSFSDPSRDNNNNNANNNYIYMMLSTTLLSTSGTNDNGGLSQDQQAKRKRFLLRVPKLTGYFVGTGDLFLALFMGHYRTYTIDTLRPAAHAQSRRSRERGHDYSIKEEEEDEAEARRLVVAGVVSSLRRAAAGVVGVLHRTQQVRESNDKNNNNNNNNKEKAEMNASSNSLTGKEEDRALLMDYDSRELMIVHSHDALLHPDESIITVEEIYC